MFSKRTKTKLAIYVDTIEKEAAFLKSNFRDENNECMNSIIDSFSIDPYSTKNGERICASFLIDKTDSIHLDYICSASDAQQSIRTKEWIRQSLLNKTKIGENEYKVKEYVLMKCASESIVNLLRDQGLVPKNENVLFSALESCFSYALRPNEQSTSHSSHFFSGSNQSSRVTIPADGAVAAVTVRYSDAKKYIAIHFNSLTESEYEKIKVILKGHFKFKADNSQNSFLPQAGLA